MFVNEYPYTDVSQLNLDWVIKQIQKLTNEWLETRKEWNNTETEWLELKQYVMDYFNNLDISDEVKKKIDELIRDGTILRFVEGDVIWEAPDINSGASKGDVIPFSFGIYNYYYVTVKYEQITFRMLCNKTVGTGGVPDRITGRTTTQTGTEKERTFTFAVTIEQGIEPGSNNTITVCAAAIGDTPIDLNAKNLKIIKIEGGIFNTVFVNNSFDPLSHVAQSGVAVNEAVVKGQKPFVMRTKELSNPSQTIIEPGVSDVINALDSRGINNMYLMATGDLLWTDAYGLYSLTSNEAVPEALYTAVFRKYNTTLDIHDNMLAIGYDEITATAKENDAYFVLLSQPEHHSIIIDNHDIDTLINADSTNANLPTSKAVWDMGEAIKGKAIPLTNPVNKIWELPAGVYTCTKPGVIAYGTGLNTINGPIQGTLIIVGNELIANTDTLAANPLIDKPFIINPNLSDVDYLPIIGNTRCTLRDGAVNVEVNKILKLGTGVVRNEPNEIPTAKAVWDALHPAQ